MAGCISLRQNSAKIEAAEALPSDHEGYTNMSYFSSKQIFLKHAEAVHARRGETSCPMYTFPTPLIRKGDHRGDFPLDHTAVLMTQIEPPQCLQMLDSACCTCAALWGYPVSLETDGAGDPCLTGTQEGGVLSHISPRRIHGCHLMGASDLTYFRLLLCPCKAALTPGLLSSVKVSPSFPAAKARDLSFDLAPPYIASPGSIHL